MDNPCTDPTSWDAALIEFLSTQRSLKPLPSAGPRGPWFVPRFSLRTMVIVTTLCGVLLGPLSYELYQARLVRRQIQDLQLHGFFAETGVKESTFSLWVAKNLWPFYTPYL